MSPIGKYLLTHCDANMCLDLWEKWHFQKCAEFGFSNVRVAALFLGITLDNRYYA